MSSPPRRSADIQAQFLAFQAVRPPPDFQPEPGDFAAALQLEAWRAHSQELERELADALAAEEAPPKVGLGTSALAGDLRQNLLARDVEIKGSIRFTQALTIDGKVEGEIESDGILTVGERAEIRGEIRAGSVVVYGEVHGRITVRERCELKARARLVGDLRAARLVIEEGAMFVGRSEIVLASGTPTAGSPAALSANLSKEAPATQSLLVAGRR